VSGVKNTRRVAIKNIANLETIAAVHTHTHTLCLLNWAKAHKIIIYKRE